MRANDEPMLAAAHAIEQYGRRYVRCMGLSGTTLAFRLEMTYIAGHGILAYRSRCPRAAI